METNRNYAVVWPFRRRLPRNPVSQMTPATRKTRERSLKREEGDSTDFTLIKSPFFISERIRLQSKDELVEGLYQYIEQINE